MLGSPPRGKRSSMTAATHHLAAPERAPSVLVLLVVRDAAEWLRECLQALAAQTYPRLGILAIDDASADGSHEILAHALDEGRVVRHEQRLGLARSFDEAVKLPVAAGADFLLLLHDDVELDPDAVARLVEATQLPGAERVGVVGAKVVDSAEPRRLRDVGRSSDRFGHPYTPLQAGEIDQGQFDRVLEVLSVDSCAMLVGRDVWQTIGLFDERLGDDDGDLDLCWRVRVAGWSVLMTPLARVRHRAAAERDDRPGADRSRRFEEDRAALAAVLKNYGLVTLLWVAPLGLLLSLVRLMFLILSRRFDEAWELSAAVGWNLAHLPGTLVRRRRVQKRRKVKDRTLRRFTASAGFRLPRWFQTAERILEEQRELEEEEEGEPATRRLHVRTASLVSTHPVIVAAFVATVVGLVTTRHLFGHAELAGGVLPAFPSGPSGFFAELLSAYRTTGLGGPLAASPGLGALGGLSFLLVGSTALAQKAMLIAGPALAAVLCYRAAVRLSGRPGPAVVAAAAYGLSALMLWAFSDGRIALLVAMAALPAVVERLEVAFGPTEPVDGRWRFTAGFAVTLAVGAAFVPGLLLAAVLVAIVELLGGRSRVRGLALFALSAVGAVILLFPFLPTMVAGGGAALRSEIGTTDPWQVLRLALGAAPGAWGVAVFLPIAALLGLALTGAEHRGRAARVATIAVLALALAWLSSAGYLPGPLGNAPVYAAVAAVAEAFLVAFGLSSVAGGLEREAFGLRQVGSALLATVLAGGIVLQAVAAMTGTWGVGGVDRIPAAWNVVNDAAKGSFRVLWIGAPDGQPFPAPGGDPAGVFEAGDATMTFGLTDRGGAQAIDTGRPLTGPGPDALREALGEVLSGTTVHGGALLAPFGVRYVVAGSEGLPAEARARLEAQADLDVVPASGLLILRNAVGLSPASVLRTSPATTAIVSSDRPEDIQRLSSVPASPLSQDEGGWSGPAGGGDLAVVSTEFDGAWQLEGSEAPPGRAFGWSTSFPVAQPTAEVRYGAQLPRTIVTWLLGALWVTALWVTRKPVRR